MVDKKIIPAEKFYDSISDIYEKMIDFEKNLELRIDAYKNIFPATGNLLDIGCGIGLDSIALSKNGHTVTAIDISPKMIEELNINAQKYQVNINSSIGSFDSISKKLNASFDYIISVGNTIAHLNPIELKSAVKKIYTKLKCGGKLFLHILNYDMILKENKRINNIASRDGKIIIRFYDFEKFEIRFNILSFSADSPKEHSLVTTTHYSHSKSLINKYLKASGFRKIRFAGNFSGEKYSERNSKDLFVEAVK